MNEDLSCTSCVENRYHEKYRAWREREKFKQDQQHYKEWIDEQDRYLAWYEQQGRWKKTPGIPHAGQYLCYRGDCNFKEYFHHHHQYPHRQYYPLCPDENCYECREEELRRYNHHSQKYIAQQAASSHYSPEYCQVCWEMGYKTPRMCPEHEVRCADHPGVSYYRMTNNASPKVCYQCFPYPHPRHPLAH